LADLRAPGDLENTADSVLGLCREEVDHPGEDASTRKLAELSVLKKRQLGEEVGTVRRLVWVGGVLVMASAYSSTSRSSGVNTSDSRQRGTWLAFARSRFWSAPGSS
jgi:hypothetical protein